MNSFYCVMAGGVAGALSCGFLFKRPAYGFGYGATMAATTCVVNKLFGTKAAYIFVGLQLLVKIGKIGNIAQEIEAARVQRVAFQQQIALQPADTSDNG